MAFTRKLRNIITEIKESTAKTPEEDYLPSQLVESPAVAKFKEHLAESSLDPLREQEVLDSIEKEYYQDANQFDASQHELNKLPPQVQLMEIDQDRKRLKRQLQSLSRRVSELVLENHPAYAAELERVMELERNLATALGVCQNSRSLLRDTREQFTLRALQLLSNYRRRQQLVRLLKALATIKTLQRTDVRLREMLEEEDFPGAIQLCLECQKVAQAHQHYTCISELHAKLQDTLETIEESLDQALAKTCIAFDSQHYEKVQQAYSLLGKTQSAMDQLHMHFTAAVHNKAFQIVLGYVQLCAPAIDSQYQKKQYNDLCKHISQEVFTAGLIGLCKAMWEIMLAYHLTMKWHQHNNEASSTQMDSQQKEETSTPQEPSTDAGNSSFQEEISNPGSLNSSQDRASTPDNLDHADNSLSRQYIQHKLQHGLVRLWGEIQQKVKVYLLSSDLSTFKYDELIHVLDIVNKLMQIGEEFCGSQSEGLQESIRKQSLGYFKNYHRARLDELRIFLENEAWELCPVKTSFSVLMLQEFKYLMKSVSVTNMSTSNNIENSTYSFAAPVRYFDKFLESGSPFDLETEDDTVEDVFENEDSAEDGKLRQRTVSQETDSDDEIPDELKQDFVDEDQEEKPKKLSRAPSFKRVSSREAADKAIPLVTNTTLNVCRLFGKYMQMTSVLKPIAFDVIICMSQLFDYYLYAVYSFFVKGDDGSNSVHIDHLSSRLRVTLNRVHNNLILSQVELEQLEQEENQEAMMAAVQDKVLEPNLSPAVNLQAAEGLYGSAERVVATESLIFLASQFELLQPYLEAVIPANKKAFLQQFYSQTVCTAAELRQPAYWAASQYALESEMILQQMSSVRYDLKDIMSQHSPYVDLLLSEVQKFRTRLERVALRIPLSRDVRNIVWSHMSRRIAAVFVEGFATTKKCTNEGRALMQLDFQQFLLQYEKITLLRPVPGRDIVEGYIKAYYLPETQLETWLVEHKEYSVKQLSSLVTCIPHVSKKSRQKLLLVLEDMDRAKRQT